MSPSLPLVAATIGLHGSASTWAFNVARELLLAAGPPQDTLSCYAESLGDIPPQATSRPRLVVKSHHGGPELDSWLAERQARLVLTRRDPRDAAMSMALRFKAPLRDAALWLRSDGERLLRLQDRPHLMLVYEDRFFERPETVTAMAAQLGLATPPETARAIFDAWRTEVVRAFAQTLADLPPERRQRVGAS